MSVLYQYVTTAAVKAAANFPDPLTPDPVNDPLITDIAQYNSALINRHCDLRGWRVFQSVTAQTATYTATVQDTIPIRDMQTLTTVVAFGVLLTLGVDYYPVPLTLTDDQPCYTAIRRIAGGLAAPWTLTQGGHNPTEAIVVVGTLGYTPTPPVLVVEAAKRMTVRDWGMRGDLYTLTNGNAAYGVSTNTSEEIDAPDILRLLTFYIREDGPRPLAARYAQMLRGRS